MRLSPAFAALLATALFASSARAQTTAPKYTTPNAPLLGSAWYPEQWPESAWDRDLTLMEQAHFNVVRIGEFAWSTMEPSEGRYDLAWLDRAIALAARHHISVVLGTPTDAPPAWLTAKYPDTLGVNEDGHTREHGGRRQFNYANPRYRELCRNIVAQLAQRYGHNPTVIGWQIGNEYTDESFDSATRTQFQQFLRAKYKTLDTLNARWTTTYWSQTYTDWSQIPLVARDGNPALLLEHKHFVTATWRSFQQNQIDTLRPLIAPTQFITTNIGGLAWSDNWDHYSITAPLDFASWDEYVGTGHLDVAKEAMLNDFVRGWRRQNFWIMETQPATVNWSPLNNALSPGETRALAWQAIGHGADAILYWQWRDALNGQEQYHGAIVGTDGNPLPLYAELKQLGEDFQRTRAALAHTSPHAEIAILHTYDSRWAIDFQPHTNKYDQQQVLLRFYKPLSQLAAARGEAIDIIDPTQPGDLSHYKLLVAPSLNVISEPLAQKLLAFVRNGGHLLLGPRSGMKDEYNALNPQRQPGPLTQALGAKVDQYYALAKPEALSFANKSFAVDTWAETLTTTSAGTQTLATYTNAPESWLSGMSAYVSRAVGKGTLSYLGTLPADDALQQMLEQAMSAQNRYQSPLPTIKGVEVMTRGNPDLRGGGSAIEIVINHTDSTQTLQMKDPFTDLLTGRHLLHTFELPPQGIAVLEQENVR